MLADATPECQKRVVLQGGDVEEEVAVDESGLVSGDERR
jgi:hypothetical protein